MAPTGGEGVSSHYNDGWKRVSNLPLMEIITIQLNGALREVAAGLNVRNLLNALGIDPQRVAVELNRQIIRKADWDSTAVENGAEVEVVTFVGGGWI